MSDGSGATFRPVLLPVAITELRATGGGYLAATIDDRWLRWSDGTTWEEVGPLGS